MTPLSDNMQDFIPKHLVPQVIASCPDAHIPSQERAACGILIMWPSGHA